MDFLNAKIPNYSSPLSSVPKSMCTKRIPSHIYFLSNPIESFLTNAVERIMSVHNLTSLPASIILFHHCPPLRLSGRFCSWAIKRLQWWAERRCGSRLENRQLTSPPFQALAFRWVGRIDTRSVPLCGINNFVQRREPPVPILIEDISFRHWGIIRLSWRKDIPFRHWGSIRLS